MNELLEPGGRKRASPSNAGIGDKTRIPETVEADKTETISFLFFLLGFYFGLGLHQPTSVTIFASNFKMRNKEQ